MISISDSLRSQFPLEHRRLLNRPKKAAVLVPLIEDDHEPRLILTRRSSTLSTHKGEVAFPGGMHDPQDIDLAQTALREAEEEIQLPRSQVEVLGFLDDMIPKSEWVAVTPVVGLIQHKPVLKANPAEVDRIFEIPLSSLLDRTQWRYEMTLWREKYWPVYFFDYDGETLWGLSAYIVLSLLKYTPYGSPFDLGQMKAVLHKD